MISPSENSLACGADLQDLARQVFEGGPPSDPGHQDGCRICRDALDRIRAVHADLHGLAATRVTAPASLLRSVMARLRSAAALVTVDVHARGTTAVSEGVVAAVARRAALSVSGVSYASAITAEATGTGSVALRVRLVVSYGPPLVAVAGQVREQVALQVAALTGATLSAVHVAVDDLV